MSEPTQVANFELAVVQENAAPAAPAPPVHQHRLRAVQLLKHGLGERCLMPIIDGEHGGDIMKRLKEVASHSEYQQWLHKLLGKKQAIFKGYITLQTLGDLEAQKVFCFVNTDRLEYLPHHTYAFHNPGHFNHWVGFVHDNAVFFDGAVGELGTQAALVCGWKADKLAIAVLSTVSTAITVAVSVVIGVVCHSAELGVAVAAVVVALLAFAAFVMAKLAR